MEYPDKWERTGDHSHRCYICGKPRTSLYPRKVVNFSGREKDTYGLCPDHDTIQGTWSERWLEAQYRKREWKKAHKDQGTDGLVIRQASPEELADLERACRDRENRISADVGRIPVIHYRW